MSEYISIEKEEPEFGKLVYIMTRDGRVYKAFKVDSSFYECGYCFEDIYYMDHKREDVAAWKPID